VASFNLGHCLASGVVVSTSLDESEQFAE